MNKLKKLSLNLASKVFAVTGVSGALLFGMAMPSYAVDPAPPAPPAEGSESGVLPPFIQSIIDGLTGGDDTLNADEVNSFINKRVRVALTVLFVVVFLAAIIYSALAAIKFISSQGESGKLEESKGAIKAVLMGFAAMILAIIGIFAVIFILGGTSAPSANINVDPNSVP
ncbi:MAG: hypothetical protein ABIE03_07820 [Patescibacteria group bacterium]|nr:hypothetical protein [Patescibacteria group bacterium]